MNVWNHFQPNDESALACIGKILYRHAVCEMKNSSIDFVAPSPHIAQNEWKIASSINHRHSDYFFPDSKPRTLYRRQKENHFNICLHLIHYSLCCWLFGCWLKFHFVISIPFLECKSNGYLFIELCLANERKWNLLFLIYMLNYQYCYRVFVEHTGRTALLHT